MEVTSRGQKLVIMNGPGMWKSTTGQKFAVGVLHYGTTCIASYSLKMALKTKTETRMTGSALIFACCVVSYEINGLFNLSCV